MKSKERTILCILIFTVFLMPFIGNAASAAEVTYYFDGYDNSVAWPTNPSYMVDGSENTWASTTTDGEVQLLDGNTYPGTPPGVGDITKVELSVKAHSDRAGVNNITLQPVFCGTNEGENYTYDDLGEADTWSEWFDITNDDNAPERWTWEEIACLDCKVIAGIPELGTVHCSKVDIRVTYGL